ncbi:hypothetical protein GA0070621_5058 [Micromonospora narathiwatensis]|uniref:Uncharacterized protein n=2 Tax=Micromonospora narathiwatensis TaxID=299146 RepID=A0A1A9ACN7_9ACTN|nr:hypothetical protein GA0070621_5058 [Micromonospora narathiwatensis]
MSHGRRRGVAAAAVLVGAAALLTVGPPVSPARAVDEVTDSAVTVSGRMGQLGDDWSDLKVTVSQTKNLTNQSVTVTWTGAPKTKFYAKDPNANYLQVMQCWGPDPDAPDFRETCEWGVGRYKKNGDKTEVEPPEQRSPVPADPLEDGLLRTGARLIPFRSALDGSRTPDGSPEDPFPAEGLPPDSPLKPAEVLSNYFGIYTSNEIPFAVTTGDGSGRAVFEVRNAVRDPHLGCGVRTGGASGAPRRCWLVIVPRGEREVDGTHQEIVTYRGALTPSIFADRLVVPLDFTPVDAGCPLDREERGTVGTEMIAEAVLAWQPALCANNGPVFAYSTTGDEEAVRQVLDASNDGPGLAFTSDPVVPEEGQPPVVQTPVAVSSVVIAFNIDLRLAGTVPPEMEPLRRTLVRNLKLTPRLLAKLLTQSYVRDVPDGNQKNYVADNPRSLGVDPEFLALNPDFAYIDNGFAPDGIVVPYGNFAAAREVWRWVLADPSARDWLNGKPDGLGGGPHGKGMEVNPNYRFVSAGAQDYFPRTDPSCINPEERPDLEEWQQEPSPGRCTLDLFPYAPSLGESAYQTLRADTKQASNWQPSFDRSIPGKYGKEPPKQVGQRFALSITDSASAARYGLHTAQLCKAVTDADGNMAASDCRTADTTGMLAGADAMVPSKVPGVRTIDPLRAVATPKAYPLTMVTYAAATLGAPAEARRDYASLLRYVAGNGQQPGQQPGQLPEGYAPLPQAMRAQTLTVADTLERYQPPSPSPTPTPNQPPATTAPAASEAPTSTPTDTASEVPNQGVPPTPAPPAPSQSPPVGKPIAQLTPGSPLGQVRWVVVALLVVGVLGGMAGPVLLMVSRRLRSNSGGPA